MLMMEHAGKSLLKAYGVPVPAGAVVKKAADAAKWRGTWPVALKVQVSSGGRGKAGGVVRADDADQAQSSAHTLFEREFGGERAASLLIEPWVAYSRELYLAVTVDGQSGGYVLLYGPSG